MLSSYTKMSLLRGKKDKKEYHSYPIERAVLNSTSQETVSSSSGKPSMPSEHGSSVESTAPMEDVAFCRHPAAPSQALFCLTSRKMPYMCLNMVR